MSLCLQSVGVHAEDTMTDDGRIRSLVWRPSAHLSKKRSSNFNSWYWKGKANRTKDKKECCAVDAMSLHPYKSSSSMLKVHRQLNNLETISDSLEGRYLKKIRDYMK